jgi:hypothetical protein
MSLGFFVDEVVVVEVVAVESLLEWKRGLLVSDTAAKEVFQPLLWMLEGPLLLLRPTLLSLLADGTTLMGGS